MRSIGIEEKREELEAVGWKNGKITLHTLKLKKFSSAIMFPLESPSKSTVEKQS